MNELTKQKTHLSIYIYTHVIYEYVYIYIYTHTTYCMYVYRYLLSGRLGKKSDSTCAWHVVVIHGRGVVQVGEPNLAAPYLQRVPADRQGDV